MSETISDAIIQVQNISKTFKVGEQNVEVLHDISVEIHDGDFTVILGPSGSGKSTLMHIMLGLEAPTTGTVKFFETNLYDFKSEDDRSDFRKKHIGMVYQQPHWIRALTVAENVAFPLLLLGHEREYSIEKAHEMLGKVGIREWADYIPTELSSGQQQRVTLARALVNNPLVVFADEPTGNLDYESGQMIMQLLSDLNKTDGKTVIMVTHDLEYVSYANTAVHIFDGTVAGIYTGKEKENFMRGKHLKRGADKNKPKPNSTIGSSPKLRESNPEKTEDTKRTIAIAPQKVQSEARQSKQEKPV